MLNGPFEVIANIPTPSFAQWRDSEVGGCFGYLTARARPQTAAPTLVPECLEGLLGHPRGRFLSEHCRYPFFLAKNNLVVYLSSCSTINTNM